MKEIRAYQSLSIEKIVNLFKQPEINRVMYVLPTGGGKTTVFIDMLKMAERNNIKCAVICHLVELKNQTQEVLDQNGIKAQVHTPHNMDLSDYGFVVFDEVHHIAASEWLGAFDTCKGKVLGVTATPFRLDDKPITDLFDSTVFGPNMRELIKHGYLSAPDIWHPEDEKPNGTYVKEYLKRNNGKKMICFCTTKVDAKRVAKEFSDKGVPSGHLLSGMTEKKRASIISKYREGEIKIITTCGVIGEGFDVPDTDGVILLRKTLSRTLFLQQVGRALRRTKNKMIGVIQDHVCNSLVHGSPIDYDPEIEYLSSIGSSTEDTLLESYPNRKVVPVVTWREVYCDTSLHRGFPSGEVEEKNPKLDKSKGIEFESRSLRSSGTGVDLVRLNSKDYLNAAFTLLQERPNRYGFIDRESAKKLVSLIGESYV